MNPIVFALRRPVTVLMLVLALGLAGVSTLIRMQKDIFPALNQPVLYVVHSYGGMDPKQVEGLITNLYEIMFQYTSGLEHIESRSVQSMVMLKLYFQPGTNMAEATASAVANANRAVSMMPVGSQPPFMIRLDSGSLPVGYLVFSSETKTIGQLQDQAMFRVRPQFAALPGVMSPPPFGGNMRTITVNVDPDRLRSYNLSPQDIVEALDRGNYASPSGNVQIKDELAVVPANTMVLDPKQLANIPLKLGQNVYIRDVGNVADSTDLPTGYALVNGRKSVYIPVVKRSDASTLTVVNTVKSKLQTFRDSVDKDISIDYQFDESPIVYRAIESVAVEGALGGILTGLMVLLFLRDLRSVIVVIVNIPMALLGSIVVLGLTGNTINVMTLGGLALAIGILVDEATVEIENIHVQMTHTPSMSRAVRNGNDETAVPRLLALLCILSVFIPAFLMEGAVQALFVPLSLAVGASMITSYVLSSTLVPVLSVWLLRGHEHDHDGSHEANGNGDGNGHGKPPKVGLFERFQAAFARVVAVSIRWRRTVVVAYLIGATLIVVGVGSQLGRELFPRVDAGQMQLRIRPPQGTHYELTRQVAEKTIDAIADVAGKDNVAVTMGYVGATPPMFTVNLAYLWMRGPDDGMMRVAFKHKSGVEIFALQEKLRAELPKRIGAWFRTELLRLGVPEAEADSKARGLVFAFEPGDLISATMSLGASAPIEVVVSGRNLGDSGLHMDRIRTELNKIASLRDMQIQQSLHYPTVSVTVDRERAGLSGVTARDVGDSLISATYSSRYIARNYWRDDSSGTSYQVQVQVPPPKMTEATDVALVPISPRAQGNRPGGMMADEMVNLSTNPQASLLIRDVAHVSRGEMPGEVDRYNMRRYLSLTANVEGEDLGHAINRINEAIRAAGRAAGDKDGNPPRGLDVTLRGQAQPLTTMFRSLTIGLIVAVVAILIMLTAYFQSFRLALTGVASVPAVLSGVVLMLFCTRTTLNIQSFMGAIMSVGVAVSNAILLVSFGDRHRREDRMNAADAALEAARGRLRPIIMTSCAMISGMIPMSLGLEEGSEQNAPLGRAVMGGMAFATAVSLLVLPAVFTLLMGRVSTDSASLDPDDPESPYFDEHGHRAPVGAGHHSPNGNGNNNGNNNGHGQSNGSLPSSDPTPSSAQGDDHHEPAHA